MQGFRVQVQAQVSLASAAINEHGHTNETLGRGVPLIGLLGGAPCLLLLPATKPVAAALAAASAAASAASQSLAASAVTAICTQCSAGQNWLLPSQLG